MEFLEVKEEVSQKHLEKKERKYSLEVSNWEKIGGHNSMDGHLQGLKKIQEYLELVKLFNETKNKLTAYFPIHPSSFSSVFT